MIRSKIVLIPLIILLFITIILYLNLSSISNLAVGHLQRELRKSGIYTTLQEPRLRFVGLSTPDVLLHIQGSLLSFPLKDLDIDLSPAQALTGTLDARAQASLYNGQIHLHGKRIGEVVQAELDFQGVNISENPQIAGFGITSGNLSGNITDFSLHGKEILGEAHINIEKLEKPDQTKLAALLTGLPFDITLPAFLKGNISLELKAAANTLYIKNFVFKSSLGDIQLEGTAGTQGAHALKLKGAVRLSESGAEELGDYLPLLSLGKLKKTDTSFKFTTTGNLTYARSTFTTSSPSLR